MSENEAAEILKGAVLLEIRGRDFYRKVAGETQNGAVGEFFEKMAQEEEMHIKALSEQFKAWTETNRFITDEGLETSGSENALKVLSEKLKDQISSAGFEASAIAAAMAMEKEAIAYYSARADATKSSEEKSLYDWLSKWETQHLEMLASINDALARQFWTDNQFWPF